MFLPIGDEPNPHHLPVVTVAIIAVNVAVFLLLTLPLSTRAADPADPLLMEYLRALLPNLPPGISPEQVASRVSAYDLMVFDWGYRPGDPGLVSLITAMFLHGGFMHLFGNMLYLWIYGNNVEHRLGGPAFLFWYLATGVAATLFHGLFNMGSQIPLVGASGAISGVLGFYLVWFPRHVVKIWMFLIPFYVGVVRISATIVLIMYLVLDNLLPMLMSGGQGGVAHGAHIGGFIAGMAVAFAMRLMPRKG
jgi:membrane associated rhomboid family serine protease